MRVYELLQLIPWNRLAQSEQNCYVSISDADGEILIEGEAEHVFKHTSQDIDYSYIGQVYAVGNTLMIILR